jgi:hypothetical protein
MLDSKTVLLPDSCCVCLGKVNTSTSINKVHKKNETKTTQSLKIPICYSCDDKLDKKAKNLITICTLTGALLYPAISFFWGGDSSPDRTLMIRIISLITNIVPIVIGGLIGFSFGSYLTGLSEPVKLKPDGEIIFKNKKYQKLFIQLNEKDKT